MTPRTIGASNTTASGNPPWSRSSFQARVAVRLTEPERFCSAILGCAKEHHKVSSVNGVIAPDWLSFSDSLVRRR